MITNIKILRQNIEINAQKYVMNKILQTKTARKNLGELFLAAHYLLNKAVFIHVTVYKFTRFTNNLHVT